MALCCVVFFPVLFYVPKAFEYRYQTKTSSFTLVINCSEYANELARQRAIQEIQWVRTYVRT